MPLVQEPRLQLGQLCSHLPALLCKTLSRCPLLLGVFTVRRASRCKPRQAILRLGPCRSTTVQRAASVALVSRPLAGRALTGLGPTPLAGPIGAKAPWDTLFKVAVCHAEHSASYKVLVYPIFGSAARVRRVGPCTLVRAKLNNANWFYA